MKTLIILAIAALSSVATASYSQSTTGSEPKKQPAAQSRPADSPHPGDRNEESGKVGKPGNTDGTAQQARKSQENDGSTRPGGAAHENANDAGRYSDGDSKSLLNNAEALEQRRKNLTETDTTVKDGSGSSPRNMKNHTGKTGNYRNQEMKRKRRIRANSDGQ